MTEQKSPGTLKWESRERAMLKRAAMAKKSNLLLAAAKYETSARLAAIVLSADNPSPTLFADDVPKDMRKFLEDGAA